MSPAREAGETTRIATGPDGRFSLSFIHSVSRTPVTDLYRIEHGEIVQTAEIFEAHGAGLPSSANDIGASGWRHENGRFVLEMRRLTGPIHLRVQAEYRNTLHTPDLELPLAKLGARALVVAPCAAETKK